MHESFDRELRRRLRKYSEEPAKDLWQNIAPHANAMRPHPAVWVRRLPVLIIAVSTIFFLTNNTANFQKETMRGSLVDAVAADTVNTARAPAPLENRMQKMNGQDNLKYSRRAETPLDTADSRRSEPLIPMQRVSRVILLPEATSAVLDTGRMGTLRTFSTSHSVDSASLYSSVNGPTSQRQKKNIRRRIRPSSLYFAVMPTFGYQRIESNTKDNILIESIKRIPAFSTERLGVRLEAGLQGPVSKRWRAFGGILYYQRKQTISYVEKFVDTLVTGTGPQGDPMLEPQLSYLSKSAEHEVKNIGVHFGLAFQLRNVNERPLRYRYFISGYEIPAKRKKHFVHEVGTGVELHKSLSNAHRFSAADGYSDPSMYAFINMYYRLQYPHTGRLRAVFQPTLNYSFYINKAVNSPFYVKPYGVGLNFGCVYHF